MNALDLMKFANDWARYAQGLSYSTGPEVENLATQIMARVTSFAGCGITLERAVERYGTHCTYGVKMIRAGASDVFACAIRDESQRLARDVLREAMNLIHGIGKPADAQSEGEAAA